MIFMPYVYAIKLMADIFVVFVFLDLQFEIPGRKDHFLEIGWKKHPDRPLWPWHMFFDMASYGSFNE